MKIFPLLLASFLLTSCMDITIPDFKSNRVPEDEKEDETGEENTDNENEEEETEPPIDNTYPLISSATIPSEFLPYISLFIFYGNMFGKDLNYSNLIISLESGIGVAGQCSSINDNQNKLIKINSDMWPGLNSTYREQLIFHEAAHCLLNRSHKGNDFYNPESIMNTTLFPDSIYVQRYNEFIYELFEGPIEEHEFIFGEMEPQENEGDNC